MKIVKYAGTFAATVLAVVFSGCDLSTPATAETSKPHATTKAQLAIHVQASVIKSESFTPQLELTGKALAAKESKLSLGVSGLIDRVLVKRGDRVKKGQLLLKLDRKGFQLAVQRTQAAIDGVQVTAEQLGTEVERVDQLLVEGAAPTATKDDLVSKQKAAQAQLRMATAAHAQAQKALSDSQLRAPYAGVITEIYKEKGEQAPAMPPTMLMKIIDTDTLEVQVFVPESAARFVRVGTVAQVAIDSAAVVRAGSTIFVSDAIQPDTRTFEARIRIDNKDGAIKAGSFARVRLRKATISDAVLIPVATMARDENDRPYVFVADKGIARKKQIKTGALSGSRIYVRSGLAAGQQLITSDLENLSDGQRVTVDM